MKLKGLSLGQICVSFAYHSIEKLMWCTKHLVSAVGTVMEKKVLFFHKPFQERKECTFMFLLEDISFHNVKKAYVVNGWQQFLAENFCRFIRALLQLDLCKFNWTSAKVKGRVRMSTEMG